MTSELTPDPDFAALTHSEKIKFILPDRVDRIKYYGIVAGAMCKGIVRDVIRGVPAVLANKQPTRDFQKEYLHQADAWLFDVAVNNGVIQLNPESLLSDNWQSEVEG